MRQKLLVTFLLIFIATYSVSAQVKRSSSYTLKNGMVNIIPILSYYGINYRYDAILHKLSITPSTKARAEFIDGSSLYYIGTKIYNSDISPKADTTGFFISVKTINNIGSIIFDKNTTLKVRNIGRTPALFIERLEKSTNVEIITPANLPQINESRNTSIDVIIIDAGHGGKDYGAIGVDELPEKEITLAYALALRLEIKKYFPRKKIFLTRDKDVFFTLDERSRIANKYAGIGTDNPKNAIFISVHANASINNRAKGFEMYFLSADESSEYARSMASFENNVAVNFEIKKSHTYTNYSETLYYYMLIEQYQKESSYLASLISKEVLKVKGTSKRSQTVQSALFYVLKGSLMPAVLIETGFITNPNDAKLLTNKKYKASFIKATTKGIVKYINQFEKTRGFTD